MAPDEVRPERDHDLAVTARRSPTQEVFGGSARVFAAEAISLPTGLITAAFLARRFGPSGYGIFTLTMAIVVWLEWSLASLLARPAVKLIADANEWRPVGAMVLRTYLVTGLAGFVALYAAAGPLASLMHEPSLTHHLRVLGVDIPLFMAAQAHQQVLVGTGAYARRATVAAWRWSARMVLVLALVGAGRSIDGAFAAIVGASVLELVVARRYVRPGFRGGSAADASTMWRYAFPLFAAAISLRLFDKLDLFVLKALGGSDALVGLYGGAQNLAIIPNLIALSMTTLLLSTLSRTLRAGDTEGARVLAQNALRGVVVLFPFAGVAAGASTALSTMIYGGDFAGAGPLLSVLIFASMMMAVVSVASAILTAAWRPSLAMIAALPVAPLALLGHLLVIPRFGARGATVVTLVGAALGAGLSLVAVNRVWRVQMPWATVARVAAATTLTTALGAWWDTTGAFSIVELGVMSVVAIMALVVSGELTPQRGPG